MNLARDIQKLNRMLSDLDQKSSDGLFQRRWHKHGTNRRWILKNVPRKPIKITEFLTMAEKDGLVRGSVYAMLIRMVDEGEISENRYFRTVWKV